MSAKKSRKDDDNDNGGGNFADTDDDGSSLSLFFERVDDMDSLSPDDFLERFERFGFLWFRAGSGNTATAAAAAPTMLPSGNEILGFVQNHAAACETSWTVENHGTQSQIPPKKGLASSGVTPKSIPEFTGTADSFYVSTIVHRTPAPRKEKNSGSSSSNDDDGTVETSEAHNSLMKLLPRFDSIFEDIYENGDSSGTWLFLGHHGVHGDDTATTSGAASGTKKRKHRDKKDRKAKTLAGRAEHVDEVTHSGTYHIQIAGTKTWKIRPHPDSFLVEELMLDSKTNSNNWKLKITVEEGDVFVLNTKAWYHSTELNCDPVSEWSISVAQDFYLPVPCPRDVTEGDVVYGYSAEKERLDEEDETREQAVADEEIPEELPRSDNPNCALVEIEAREDDDTANGSDNDDDDDDESSAMRTKIALIALRDIAQGESLTIAFDDDEGQLLGNANEQMDPRVISQQDWSPSDIVLRGEDRIPEDIPRSYEPNCELVEIEDDSCGGEYLVLRALVNIPEGGIFCISPDDDEEYDEVEVDLGTGEVL